MATGFVWDERFMWHHTGAFAGVVPYGFPVEPYEHAENPDTKRRFKNLLDASGLTRSLILIDARPATTAELLRFHTPAHIERMAATGDALLVDGGAFTPMGRGSYEIALLAAGGVIEAVDAVLAGRVANAYALVRPPGHHAMPDLAMGFCLFGNGAIAGLHALAVHGLERIAYVDWDVHHGNGTQAAFFSDPRALTISVHQDRNFPHNSGGFDEIGTGAGRGYNINVPLPPGSGVGAYEAVYDRVVIPALAAYRPQLIIVPSGFDGGAYDPLGRMMMTSGGYRRLTRKLMQAAEVLCDGRIVMCHEGGYSAATVPFFGLAVVETLAGIATGIEDPFEPLLANMGQQELQPHQNDVIEQAEALLRIALCR
jgi:acetoin utilization deacetylase AcuC-like enzyme